MSSIEKLAGIQALFNTASFEAWCLNAHEILQEIENYFDGLLASLRKARIEPIDPSASIHPKAVLEDDVIISKRVYIGPFSYIRSHSIILSGAKIGYNVEVIKSIIMQNTKISHMACIANSLIGNDCNLAAGFITTTGRVDGKQIKICTPSTAKFHSERKHHGVVVGPNVRVGVDVITMPGSTVGENAVIYPRSTVSGYITCNFIGFTKGRWEK